MNYRILKDYASKVLSENGCYEWTYSDSNFSEVMEDLMTAYPTGMDYPYNDVAIIILTISRGKSKPKIETKSRYRVVYDGGEFVDGFPANSLEEAKSSALDVLINWMMEEESQWKYDTPDKQEIDNWNYMIDSCSVYVQEYDSKTGEYEECWWPSDEDYEEIGWAEFEVME